MPQNTFARTSGGAIGTKDLDMRAAATMIDAVSMQDFPWDTLITSIADKRCTPFIGAGACSGVLPRARQLAEILVADDEASTERACPLPDRGDLGRVCQYLAVTRESGLWPKQRIAATLTEMCNKLGDKTTALHNVLAGLQLPVYLTTNYDDLMGKALEAGPAREVRRDFARWSRGLFARSSRFDEGWEPSVKEPVVFHLHGVLGEPSSMVATEDDYVDFLVNLSKDLANPPTHPKQKAILPLAVHRALTSNMLLFVGYGLADMNFRVILRSLVGSLDLTETVDGIAIQYSEGDGAELLSYMRRYFRRSLRLNVYWCSADNFAAELGARLAEAAKGAAAK
jgi:hypothetical protein